MDACDGSDHVPTAVRYFLSNGCWNVIRTVASVHLEKTGMELMVIDPIPSYDSIHVVAHPSNQVDWIVRDYQLQRSLLVVNTRA